MRDYVKSVIEGVKATVKTIQKGQALRKATRIPYLLMEKNVLPEINDVFTRKEITALLKQRVFVPPQPLFSAPELISQTSCLKSTHNTASCRHELQGIPPLTLSRKPLSTAPAWPPPAGTKRGYLGHASRTGTETGITPTAASNLAAG